MPNQKFFTYFIILLVTTLSISFMSLIAVVTLPYWSSQKSSPQAPMPKPAIAETPSQIKIVTLGRNKPQTHPLTAQTTAEDIQTTQPAMAFQMPKQPVLEENTEVSVADLPKNARIPSPVLKSKAFPGREIHYQMTQEALILSLPQRYASVQNIKRAVSRLLISDHLIAPNALLSRRSLSAKKLPYFYGRILDAHQRPIRYPHQAYAYADYLMQSHLKEKSQQGIKWVELSMPLAKKPTLAPVKKYQDWVADYAKQFEVDPALVFAVMETESGFNPKAVSRSNALGLMQLKPHTAGLDVSQHIDLSNEVPDQEVLFNSQKNIRMGTAYLGLLQNKYLSEVRNKMSKKILAVAAYNGGLSTVLKLFGKTKPEAIAKLNRLHPKQIYRTLRQQHQSAETRAYLDKVLKAEQKYQEIIHS